ncbi:MAG: MarR family winged helix-turn-helix transcriptional regulator [Actinomycetota bacterium]
MGESEILLDDLTLLSRDFFRLIADCLSEHTDQAEISPTQFRALSFLVQRGPHNSSDLAETLSVGRPAATKLVDRLERVGMIRRQPHATDKRQVILEATGEGFELVQAVQRCRRRKLANLLSEIEPSARKALLRGLPSLAEAFERAADRQKQRTGGRSVAARKSSASRKPVRARGRT